MYLEIKLIYLGIKKKSYVSGNKRITLNKVKFMPGNTKIHICQVKIGVIYCVMNSND